MDLIDFREVMDKYITHTLREDEIARSNRVFLLDPYFEGITDTKTLDGNEQLKNCYEEEEQEITDYIQFFKSELQIPFGSYTAAFKSVCQTYKAPCDSESVFFKLSYREYLKTELHILAILLKRVKGEYEFNDANQITASKIERSDIERAKIHSQKLQQFGSQSGAARSIESDANYPSFVKEVRRLYVINPHLTAADMAKRALKTVPLDRQANTMERYVSKIIKTDRK